MQKLAKQKLSKLYLLFFSVYPVPETDYLQRCFPLLCLYKLCRPCSPCEVLFCYAVISKRFSLVCLPVDDLDCLPVYECLLPGYSDPACLADLFYCLSATFLEPQQELCVWICPAFAISDASYWFMPVWLVLGINKAAHGSWRHCPLITIVQTLVVKSHRNWINYHREECVGLCFYYYYFII